MICSCHGSPMYWNIDKRYRAGGQWQCREKRRERNRRRIRVYDTTIYLPNLEAREFAVHLREQRKEAMRGRTEK